MAVGAWEGLPGAVFTPGAAAAGFLSPLAGAVAVLGLTFCNQRVGQDDPSCPAILCSTM